jgi:hypothetical protein
MQFRNDNWKLIHTIAHFFDEVAANFFAQVFFFPMANFDAVVFCESVKFVVVVIAAFFSFNTPHYTLELSKQSSIRLFNKPKVTLPVKTTADFVAN